MKSLMMYTVFAAASLAPLAMSANAQILTAEIPFSFHAGTTGMTAGSYEVSMVRTASNHVLSVKNRDTNKAVMLVNVAGTDPSKAWRAEGKPKLGFECVETRCVLRQVWTGEGSAVKINSPKPGRDEAIQLTEIRLTRVPGF